MVFSRFCIWPFNGNCWLIGLNKPVNKHCIKQLGTLTEIGLAINSLISDISTIIGNYLTFLLFPSVEENWRKTLVLCWRKQKTRGWSVASPAFVAKAFYNVFMHVGTILFTQLLKEIHESSFHKVGPWQWTAALCCSTSTLSASDITYYT